eukprot:640764-Amorphochlora_amoeboformis.AAC.2
MFPVPGILRTSGFRFLMNPRESPIIPPNPGGHVGMRWLAAGLVLAACLGDPSEMSEVMLESGKGFGVGLRQRKREGVSDLRGVPRRRRKGDEGEAMAYGLRQIEENDIER